MPAKRATAKKPTVPLPEPLIGYKLLTDAQTQEMSGLTRRKRRELESKNEFPQPIKVNQKLRLYPSREVLAWVQEREAERCAD